MEDRRHERDRAIRDRHSAQSAPGNEEDAIQGRSQTRRVDEGHPEAFGTTERALHGSHGGGEQGARRYERSRRYPERAGNTRDDAHGTQNEEHGERPKATTQAGRSQILDRVDDERLGAVRRGRHGVTSPAIRRTGFTACSTNVVSLGLG